MLALAAMVVSLGACTGQQKTPSQESSEPESVESIESIESDSSDSEPAGPIDATILEVLDLGAEGWELEGERVKVSGLTIQARFGTSFICGIATGQYINTLRGIQVDCREGAFPNFQHGSGFGAAVTVEGTVTNVNGRCVLADAVISDLNERQYDADGNRIDGTGGSLSYCPAQYFDRDFFDSLGRSMSGIFMEGLFEIRSLPQPLTVPEEGQVTTQGTSFQVVFPGEYGDVDDEENYSLITVYVPAGLRKVGAESFNKLFFTEGKELAVNDYINIDYATTYWNNWMGLLMEDFACQNSKKSTETPTILHRWEEVAEILGDAYRNPVVDLAGAGDWDTTDPTKPVWVPDEEDDLNLAYSYSADASIATEYAPDEYLKPEFVTVDDSEDCAITKAGVVVKPADMEAYIGAVKERLMGKADDENDHGLGWTLNASLSQPDEGAYIFDLIEGEGDNAKTVQELIVEHGTQSVVMFYIAPKAELSFDNFAALEAQINTIGAGKLENANFETALVNFPAGEGLAQPVKYTINWMQLNENAAYEGTYGCLGSVMLTLEFKKPGENEQEVDRAKMVAAWLEALDAAGFVEANFALFDADCLYNPLTNEILFIDIDSEEGSRAVNCQITFLDNKSSAYVDMYAETIDEAMRIINLEYAGAVANYATFAAGKQSAPAQSSLSKFLLGDPAAMRFSIVKSLANQKSGKGQLVIQLALSYNRALTPEDGAFIVGGLHSLGFADNYMTPNLSSVGLYNASTHEFVAYQLSKDAKTLAITLVWNNNAAAAETIPVPISDADLISKINAAYAGVHADAELGLIFTSEQTTAFTDFTIGSGEGAKEASQWRFSAGGYPEDGELLINASAIYDEALTAEDLEAFDAKVAALGFTTPVQIADWPSLGLGWWNATTHEFLVWSVDADDPAKINLKIVLIGDTKIATLVDDGTTENNAILYLNAMYADLNGWQPSYFPTAASGLTTLTLGTDKAPVQSFGFTDDSEYQSLLLRAELVVAYGAAPTEEEVEALLTAAGFVGGATVLAAAAAGLGVPATGWWNATTGELLTYEISGNTLVIEIVNMPQYAEYVSLPQSE